jgi:hypothetical protein
VNRRSAPRSTSRAITAVVAGEAKMTITVVGRMATTLGLLALQSTAAHAASVDCRRIPVYSAPCFSQPKPHPGCAPIPYASAPCFVVHGALSPANGTPSFRILKLGTKRILGVLGGDGDAASSSMLPPGLRAIMAPASPGDLNSVSGEFRICPLATERAGWMQPVCIVSARHVAVVPRRRQAA